MLRGRIGQQLQRLGLVPATPEDAQAVLDSAAALMVFPGGCHDAGRPTAARNVIDFGGSTGYVNMAVQAGVPTVSIGGHENHLHLTRGTRLARTIGLRTLFRMPVLPISVGFPFGLSLGTVLPLNAPLPTKIVTQVLTPIDISAEFGDDARPHVVDAYVRQVMHTALDHLAQQRRFPCSVEERHRSTVSLADPER